MERFVAGLIKEFEAGKITRRQFCEAIALAAAVYGAGGAAKAAPARGLKILGVNHISISYPDYRKARDFYSSVLGMQVLSDNGKDRANLAFGPPQGKGGQYLIARNFGNAPAQAGKAIVDHVCYTVPNWNEARLDASLKAAGANPINSKSHQSINVFDPDNMQVQLASIVGENAWKA